MKTAQLFVIDSAKSRLQTVIKVLFVLAAAFSCGLGAQEYGVTRLNGSEPIITKWHFQNLGSAQGEWENINGPSVLRIPDWIPKNKRASPEARYYMYFGHHHGRYIRLAWSENVEGPWSLYHTGKGAVVGERGVLDNGKDRMLAIGNSLTVVKHIASPDVHIDHAEKRIVMYFHGPTKFEGEKLPVQRSFVASSPWGLDFSESIEPVPLGESYLRVFEFDGISQGLTGLFYFVARNGEAPWSVPDGFNFRDEYLWKSDEAKFLDFSSVRYDNGELFAPGETWARHVGLYLSGTTLYVFFTLVGHSPERILLIRADLSQDCWQCTEPVVMPIEILRAERPWEGSAVGARASRKGTERQLANALRDPYVFEDEGKLYLFYVGGGEQAIGVAELTLLLD